MEAPDPKALRELADERARLEPLGFILDTPERDTWHTPGRCLVWVIGYSTHTGPDVLWHREYIDIVRPWRRDLSDPDMPGWDPDDVARIKRRGDFSVIQRVWWQPFKIGEWLNAAAAVSQEDRS